MKGYVARNSEISFRDLGGGVCRRVLAYNPEIMAVEVAFETGAEGSVHTHPHTQISYVLSGKFSYSIDGEAVELNVGDTICVPAGEKHGTVCLEKGVLLDMFAPMREDFLK